VITYLSDLPDYQHQLLHNYIHFQRQVDYIYLDDERIVKNVFCLRHLDHFFATITEKTGIVRPVLTESQAENIANQSRLYRNYVFRWIDISAGPIRKQLSRVFPYNIRRLYKWIVKAPTSNSYCQFSNASVRLCIETYYKKDIELFESMCSKSTSHVT
jgi:hypothetical protein